MRSVPLCYADLESPALLYIAQEVGLLVSYNVRVLVGLQDSNVTRITYGEFLVRLDLLSSLRGTPRALHRQAPERHMVELGSLLVPTGLAE